MSSFEALAPEHFEALVAAAPEVVIFGSGSRLRFPHPRLTAQLAKHRIGVETMDFGAACRTYNILIWMERVLPDIVRIAELNPPRTVFTRFITPLRAEDRPGRWQRYFNKWECATRSRLSSSQLEIVSPRSPWDLRPRSSINPLFFWAHLTGVDEPKAGALPRKGSWPLRSPELRPRTRAASGALEKYLHFQSLESCAQPPKFEQVASAAGLSPSGHRSSRPRRTSRSRAQ